MSSAQLWAPKPQRPAENAASTLRSDTAPGTWLQLSPISSAIASPSMNAQPDSSAPPSEELLLTPSNSKFLSNQSRTSSMSSNASSVRHPSLGQRAGVACAIERREVALGRIGGVSTAFGAKH